MKPFYVDEPPPPKRVPYTEYRMRPYIGHILLRMADMCDQAGDILERAAFKHSTRHLP